MADAPKSLEEQLNDQAKQLASTIQEQEAALMRSKEAFLKVTGAQEYAAILKQQKETAEAAENVSTEVVDP
jgi:hypothetical protein